MVLTKSVLACQSTTPRYKDVLLKCEEELPELQKSSDLMWAMWEHYVHPADYKDLNFFMTLSIENPITLSLMKRALDTLKKELTTAGVLIGMDTDAGKALLSTLHSLVCV
jgi:hypothetical protein